VIARNLESRGILQVDDLDFLQYYQAWLLVFGPKAQLDQT
jgi:hypothetical protein